MAKVKTKMYIATFDMQTDEIDSIACYSINKENLSKIVKDYHWIDLKGYGTVAFAYVEDNRELVPVVTKLCVFETDDFGAEDFIRFRQNIKSEDIMY